MWLDAHKFYHILQCTAIFSHLGKIPPLPPTPTPPDAKAPRMVAGMWSGKGAGRGLGVGFCGGTATWPRWPGSRLRIGDFE